MIIPSNFGASPWTGTTIFSSAGPKQSKSESTSDTKPAESPTSTSDKTRPAEPSTRLEQLERLRQQGLVTEDEYREKRRRIIEEF